MVCNKCGSIISEGLKFCPTCGNSLNEISSNQQFSNMNNINNNYNVDSNIFENKPSNNDNKKMIYVIIAVLVLAAIAGFILLKNKSNDKKSNSNSNSKEVSNSNATSNITSNPTSNITSNPTSNVTSNPTSNVTPTPTPTPKPTNQSTVKHGGFVFNLPTTYTVNANTDQLLLIGKDNIHVAAINIISGNYEQLKKNNKVLVNQMKSSGYTIGSVKVKKYSKTEFIIIPVAQGNKKLVMAYAKLTNKKLIFLALANTSYTLDYSQLPTFAQMIQSAKVAN